jgi:phage host-nuclease inhibitor protein Gam
MKSKTRIKISLPMITTRDEAEAVMNDLALAVNKQRKIAARRDNAILKINDEYATDLADCETTITAKSDTLRAWAESQPEVFPKGRKSLTLLAGTLGFRTGTPKLAVLSRAWNWDKVLAMLQSLKHSAYIRTKTEVDKDAILGAHSQSTDKPATEKGFATFGCKVIQEESFFVDPDLTTLEPRQTQEAA